MLKNNTLLCDYKKTQWFIFAIAFLIYANTIPNKWAVDDSLIIHQNKFVQKGISGIGDIVTKDAFTGFYGQDVNAVTGGRYRPLTPMLFAVQAELFASVKKDENQKIVKDKEGFKIKDLSEKTWFPHILHFFNMLWYGFLCLVLYRTLLLLFSIKNKENVFKNNFLALGTSLLFAVHPLHTEAVANVKGLDEILALLGALASLYCVLMLLHINTGNQEGQLKLKWQLSAVSSFFLALLAKESAVTFIAIIPMALWFFTQASVKTILKLTWPLLIPLVLFLGIRTAVLHQPNKGVIAEELMNDPFLVLDDHAQYAPLIEGLSIKKLVNPNANTFTKMPYSNQLATNFYTWGKYLQLLVLPYPLTVDYYPRHIEIKSFENFEVIFSVLLHMALLGWALLHTREKKMVAFGILYYFITFSIVSNLFFPIGTNMAERFMFMPSVGFCLVIAYMLYTMGNKLNTASTQNGFSKIYIVMGCISLVFAGLTINRNFEWKDNLTLFSKDIQTSQNSGKINTDLAGEYINKCIFIKNEKTKEIADYSLEEKIATLKQSDEERRQLLEKAIPLLKKSLEIHPTNNVGWLKMANAQHFLGQLDENSPNENLTYLYTALAAYELADYYKAAGMDTIIGNFKALCYMDYGKLMGQKFGDVNTAISSFEKAKTLRPDEPEVYLLLGTAYSVIKDYEKAIENTSRSLSLRPEERDTKQNLAVAYQQYAYSDASKRHLLPMAEKLLLEVYQDEKKMQDNDIIKRDAMIRTLDLLIRNYTIQNNSQKANIFKNELIKLNSNGHFK